MKKSEIFECVVDDGEMRNRCQVDNISPYCTIPVLLDGMFPILAVLVLLNFNNILQTHNIHLSLPHLCFAIHPDAEKSQTNIGPPCNQREKKREYICWVR